MKKYMILFIGSRNTTEEILNELAAEGWEVKTMNNKMIILEKEENEDNF